MEPFLHREALSAGVTARQLRHASLAHPVDGTALHTEDTGELLAVCRAVRLALPPDAVFTHISAAALRGWWIPFVPDAPLIACTDSEAPHHDRRGVYVRRCGIPPEHRQTLDGVQLTSPEWTVIELAEHLSLIDLVIVIDCALHRRETTVGRLWDALVPGRRGVRILRKALRLCDGRSESPWESALRLLFVLSGIRVEPQAVVYDSSGVEVGRVDLLIHGTRRAAEYDGAGHRDREQHRDDLRREKALARIGVERFGYTEIEIRRRPVLILRDAEEALGLRHDPSKLKLWNHEFELSSLSNQGRRALLRRLRRFVRTTTPRPAKPASGAGSGQRGEAHDWPPEGAFA